MDIYSYLHKDHQMVSRMMDALLATQNSEKRKMLFEQIRHELMLHVDTEEETFYATLEKVSRTKLIHEKMVHADKEHHEIRAYLEKLSKLAISSEKWMEQFGEFKHAVTHHVEEEEGEIFEKAREYLTKEQAVTLASEMDLLKKKKLQAAA